MTPPVWASHAGAQQLPRSDMRLEHESAPEAIHSVGRAAVEVEVGCPLPGGVGRGPSGR